MLAPICPPRLFQCSLRTQETKAKHQNLAGMQHSQLQPEETMLCVCVCVCVTDRQRGRWWKKTGTALHKVVVIVILVEWTACVHKPVEVVILAPPRAALCELRLLGLGRLLLQEGTSKADAWVYKRRR